MNRLTHSVLRWAGDVVAGWDRFWFTPADVGLGAGGRAIVRRPSAGRIVWPRPDQLDAGHVPGGGALWQRVFTRSGARRVAERHEAASGAAERRGQRGDSIDSSAHVR